MTTCRNHRRTDPFVRLLKDIVYDSSISFKAKGILAYALSRPDDWTFYMSEMQKHCTDGESSLRSGIKELASAGYLHRRPKQDQITKKLLGGWDWYWFEVPISGEGFKKLFGNGGFVDVRDSLTSIKQQPTKKDSINKKEKQQQEAAADIPSEEDNTVPKEWLWLVKACGFKSGYTIAMDAVRLKCNPKLLLACYERSAPDAPSAWLRSAVRDRYDLDEAKRAKRVSCDPGAFKEVLEHLNGKTVEISYNLKVGVIVGDNGLDLKYSTGQVGFKAYKEKDFKAWAEKNLHVVVG